MLKWEPARLRPMGKQDKRALVLGLTKLTEALETDQSPGEALPTGLYWDLRYKARDGLKFLRRRRNGTT